jgi:NADH dehydrogenase
MTHSAARPLLFALAGAATAGLLASRGAPQTRLRPARSRVRRSRRPACRVVVVGAGFGGLAAASRLAGRPGIHLTVIDVQNYHLFQPLLYQVATAALAPGDIASPVRSIFPESPSVKVLMDRVTGVDMDARLVLCGGQAVPYDELIIATGSQPSYFGHADWAGTAPSLKTLDDALSLRQQILDVFEQASSASPADRKRLLTFVLIGGGPTGVEMAGSIAELARGMLPRDFGFPDAQATIMLVEAGQRILSAFTPDLSDYAAAALRGMGVEIRTGTSVTEIEPGMVHLGGQVIAAATVIWTAGTEATPVAKWLGVAPAHGGRVAVGPGLRVPGHPEVAVIGDAALALDGDGKPLPGLAPVAKQQGRFVAGAILRRLRSGRAPAAFSYRDYGTLATIGRNKAVAEFGAVHMTGFPAWVTWAVAHIFFLIGFRNRIMVSAQWVFAYVTHERGNRLLIGREARS